MFEQKNHFPIMFTFITSVLVTSCNETTQTTKTDTVSTVEQATIVEKVEKTITQKVTAPKPKPPLKLSIDDIEDTLDSIEIGDITAQKSTNELDVQAQKLTRIHKDDGIKFSGELLTNRNKVANRDYLNSIDGALLNIKGSFR